MLQPGYLRGKVRNAFRILHLRNLGSRTIFFLSIALRRYLNLVSGRTPRTERLGVRSPIHRLLKRLER